MALNIADLFEHCVDVVPERNALQFGGRNVTFAELEADANQLAHFLQSRGIEPGDHVGIYAKNSIEHVVALLAIFKVRAVAINVNYRYVKGELDYLFTNADLVGLIFERGYAPLVAALAEGHAAITTYVALDESMPSDQPDVESTTFGALSYDEARAGQSTGRDFAERSDDDLYIVYTGGTTGYPKGVMWRHADFWRVLGGGIDFMSGNRLEEYDQSKQAATNDPLVTFPLSPLMHGGAQAAMLMHLFAGQLTILAPRFDADEIWQIIEREKVQLIFMTGDAMARPLIETYVEKKYDGSSLVAVSSSAAIFSRPVKERWMDALPNVFYTDSVGASETGFQGTGLQDRENIKGEGVMISLGLESVVLDEANRVLDMGSNVGVIGRLARTGSVPLGYYKDPEKSAQTFIEIDGARYSVPGDFARIEEGNRVTLLGRGSNCINTGGEKVYPEEVEQELKKHPAVYDALVVGTPDERYGAQVTAVVQPRDGQQPTLAELQEFLRESLSGYKLPRSLALVTEIPRSATGKANYPKAKEIAVSARGLGSMRTDLCEVFGIERPIFAFTPSEKVAAAVSRAGGLGVLGCVRFNDADELDQTLNWLDDNTDGKPYGVDVVMPMKIPTEGTSTDLNELIPQAHRAFVDDTLRKLGVPPLPEGEGREGVLGWLHSVARSHVEVALAHRPVLIANALGSPPIDVIERAHAHGVKVAALAGAAKHALSHVRNGVDVIVAQGYEAGGHTGEIASMVLTPEVVDAVGPDVPVLAAGGIGSGRQIAAALALGAQGVWTGSIWLTVEEYDLTAGSGIRDGLLRAGSGDTVRTRVYTGKPARLLRTKWTDAWAEPDAPEPLPMPLQNLLVADAHNRMNRGDDPDTVSMPVGQIVGRMNDVRTVAQVMDTLLTEYDEALRRLAGYRN